MDKYDDVKVENNTLLMELHEEAKKDFGITDSNLGDKLKMVAGLKTKWVELWIRNRRQLDIYRDMKKDFKERYVSEHGRPDIPKVRTEKEAASTDGIQKLELLIKKMEDVVDYLYETKNIAHSFSFDTGRVMELVKVESR